MIGGSFVVLGGALAERYRKCLGWIVVEWGRPLWSKLEMLGHG